VFVRVVLGHLLTTLQETDKATIDVEAQDDGVLAKIIVCSSIFASLSRFYAFS
jgi:hypothetical protein